MPSAWPLVVLDTVGGSPAWVWKLNFARAMLAFHNDYYWTPTTRHEPLDQGKGRFEVYVRGKLLDRRLKDGELGLRAGESWLPLEELAFRSVRVIRVMRLFFPPVERACSPVV